MWSSCWVNSPETKIQIHCEYLSTGSRSYSNWSRNWICLADHLNQGPLTRRNHCPLSHFASIIPRMSPNLVQNPSPKDKIHDDVIKWKRFPRNWSFVRGIHRSRWIPHTKASDAELCGFFDLRLNKRLSKQSWGWWFGTLSRSLWRHCNVWVGHNLSTSGLMEGRVVNLALAITIYFKWYFRISWNTNMLWTTVNMQQVSFQQPSKFHLTRRSLEPLRNGTIILAVISPALYQLRQWGLDKKNKS